MRRSTTETYQERILRVLIHIQNHLDDDLSLEYLAGVAVFSPYHFHRVFRGMVGESVKEHIRRLRMERAANRLKLSDVPITQIALESGLETHEGFSRAFRAMFDQSPTEFRKEHQSIRFQDVPSGVHYSPDGDLRFFNPITRNAQSMNVEVKQMEPTKVAFIRHIGPYMEVGETWGKLCAWAGRNGLFGPNTRCFGLSYDDPAVTPPEKLRYDACISVDDSVDPQGDIGIQTIGGGEYAVTTHRGPYENFADTYATLCGQWLPTSGKEIRSDPAIEWYKNSPQDTAPQDLITDIYLPVE